MQKRDMTKPLDRYLSPVDVWAMAFGCVVGWGVFAMPGTTFLPVYHSEDPDWRKGPSGHQE